MLLGTPVLWWGGVLALLYAGYAWVGARLAVRRRGGRLARHVAAVSRYDDRPIFSFYAVSMLPFTILATCSAWARCSATTGASRAAPQWGRRWPARSWCW